MADMILKNVAKAYGEVSVLKDINLDIKKGELVVFRNLIGQLTDILNGSNVCKHKLIGARQVFSLQ